VREQTHTGRGMCALAIASIITAFMSAQTPDSAGTARPTTLGNDEWIRLTRSSLRLGAERRELGCIWTGL